MSNDCTVFQFNADQVRIIDIDGEPWFVGCDVCKILEIKNNSNAYSRLKDYEKTIHRVDGVDNPDTVCISESGLYRLILTSRKPQAAPIQDWVTQEVLPTIRKTGQYSVTEKPALPQTYAEALLEAGKLALEVEKLEKEKALLDAENKGLEQENEQLSEAVDELFDYSSIIRVAKFNKVSETNFKWRKLKAVTLKLRLEVKRVPCPRFVEKLLYPHEAWRVAYPDFKLPETTTLVIKK